ncbi:MAG: 3'-5' exonuclease [Bacteroidota bacterium]
MIGESTLNYPPENVVGMIAEDLKFLAIDFETANRYPNSACSVGLVKVNGAKIVKKKTFLIKPPYEHFEFTHIHGISWQDVRKERTFKEVWDKMSPFFDGIDFVVAHNVAFDRRVLESCCFTYGIAVPDVEYRCTVRLSRSVLKIRPANLANVCRQLFIPLNHHEAGSDAEACARIMVEILTRKDS